MKVQPFWMDTSSLVEAHRRVYPPDRYGDFWSFLAKQISEGSICAPQQVYEEILKGEDDDRLRRFTISRRTELCILPTRTVQIGYRIIADYIKATYPYHQWSDFLGTDAWVIAFAMKIGGTVITAESKIRRKKIKIPEICEKFVVNCKNIDWMVQHFGVTFKRGQGA